MIEELIPYTDSIYTIATFGFIICIGFQLYKNWKVKHCFSQSFLWHLGTIIGLSGIGIIHLANEYYGSVIVTFIQISERIFLIWQMYHYNKKEDKKEDKNTCRYLRYTPLCHYYMKMVTKENCENCNIKKHMERLKNENNNDC